MIRTRRWAGAAAAAMVFAAAGCSSSTPAPPRPKGVGCLPSVMDRAIQPGTPESTTTAILGGFSSPDAVDSLLAVDIRDGTVRSRCTALSPLQILPFHLTVSDGTKRVLAIGNQSTQLWLRTQTIAPDFTWWTGDGKVIDLTDGHVVVDLPAPQSVYGVNDDEALVGRAGTAPGTTDWCTVRLRHGMPQIAGGSPAAPACAALPRHLGPGRYLLGADRLPEWVSTASTPVRVGTATLPSLSDQDRIYGIASTTEKSYFLDNTGTALVPDDAATDRQRNSWLTVVRAGPAWRATQHLPALTPVDSGTYDLAKASENLSFVVLHDSTAVIFGVTYAPIDAPAHFLRLDRDGATTDLTAKWTTRPRSTYEAPLIIYWPGQRPVS